MQKPLDGFQLHLVGGWGTGQRRKPLNVSVDLEKRARARHFNWQWFCIHSCFEDFSSMFALTADVHIEFKDLSLRQILVILTIYLICNCDISSSPNPIQPVTFTLSLLHLCVYNRVIKWIWGCKPRLRLNYPFQHVSQWHSELTWLQQKTYPGGWIYIKGAICKKFTVITH